MSDEQRIEQFRKMAEADPENELGHFSLGKAYVDAGRFDEAIGPLTRSLELNPRMSKAYQLLGDTHNKAGHHDEAVTALTKGVTVADEQGDRMPRDAMVAMLQALEAPVPKLKGGGAAAPTEAAAAGTSASGFSCCRCGKPGGQLEKQPFKGDLGRKIFDNVCNTCWREWIPTGTKVINELGLVLASKQGQDAYDQYMIEFLQVGDR